MGKFTFFTLVCCFFIVSCKKEDAGEAILPENRTALEFTSLTASDTVIKVGMFTTLTATASGDDLTYVWTPEFGTLTGSGPSVEWSVCHPDEFTISCEVTDAYGDSQTRSVTVYVK